MNISLQAPLPSANLLRRIPVVPECRLNIRSFLVSYGVATELYRPAKVSGALSLSKAHSSSKTESIDRPTPTHRSSKWSAFTEWSKTPSLFCTHPSSMPLATAGSPSSSSMISWATLTEVLKVTNAWRTMSIKSSNCEPYDVRAKTAAALRRHSA